MSTKIAVVVSQMQHINTLKILHLISNKGNKHFFISATELGKKKVKLIVVMKMLENKKCHTYYVGVENNATVLNQK